MTARARRPPRPERALAARRTPTVWPRRFAWVRWLLRRKRESAFLTWDDGHVGARLLTDLADATGLTAALRPLRPRGTGHDPGRVATDLAVGRVPPFARPA
ncbi:hypothetical protein [Streptomyces scopuliridis]|uniref:hypothetical protein n=1 Tax=Streptomyces scopuliridis TaxID=452529 RepID=UPI0036C23738